MAGQIQHVDSRGRDIERVQTLTDDQTSRMDDISEFWEQYPEGYPRFAAFLSHDDDKSTTIFRRFERLAARNLLYLESELFDLEAKQDQLDASVWENIKSTVTLRKWEPGNTAKTSHANDGNDQEFAYSSKEIGTPEPPSATGANVTPEERSEVEYAIRRGIKEYYKALKLYHEILHLKNPDSRALKVARQVLSNNDLQSSKATSPMLEGRMASHLDVKYKNDLCLAGPAVQQDSLADLLERQLGWIFQDSKHPHRNRALIRFPRRSIQAVAAIIGAIFFILMFLGSLFVLYFMKTGLVRLALISLMTVSITLGMAVFTNSTRIEIFGAVIGYLMITTIFVGNAPMPRLPLITQNPIPKSPSGNSIPANPVTFTTIESLQPTTTTTSSGNQPSVALTDSSSIATIISAVIGAIGTVFVVVTGIYQCRKYMKKRRSKKTNTP